MEEIAHFSNFFTKLYYGVHLTLSFSGVNLTHKRKDYCFIVVLLTALQNISYFLLGEELTIQIYPFLIHLPLIFFLYRPMKVPLLHAVLALILAFQLLSCRNWSGWILGYFMGNSETARDLATAFVTLPLAYLFGKYLAPPIAKLKEEPKIMILMSIAPVSYYCLAYVFNIYSLISLSNNQYLLSFMEAWFVLAFLAYFLFALYIFEEKRKHEVEHSVLQNIQQQAEIELKRLSSLHQLEQMHRHDMRHHGNYILSLLPQDAHPQVKEYIQTVLISPDSRHSLWSNHETLNLLLQFYQEQASQSGISLEIHNEVSDFGGISMVDLCSLLSNGLENAFKATADLPRSGRQVSLKMKSKGNTLVIHISNTYSKEPVFVHDFPHSDQEQHGFGTKSMKQICDKYHGMTRFFVKDQLFCFQTVLSNVTSK